MTRGGNRTTNKVVKISRIPSVPLRRYDSTCSFCSRLRFVKCYKMFTSTAYGRRIPDGVPAAFCALLSSFRPFSVFFRTQCTPGARPYGPTRLRSGRRYRYNCVRSNVVLRLCLQTFKAHSFRTIQVEKTLTFVSVGRACTRSVNRTAN